ncbi:hypothetical protein CAPTEDRAFT_176153 [Capitella teleta]|uniref:Dipeptidase n=1 Tax=Capitella teleta TaxID=283909 RepID=R7TN93_CAPTE|nr:hypothetical protein CAPTEDRAFT_176153 [Capitella teleta]|eukprot:ELT95114.1 hypothetical protein CAPTEDRAFT_176153 [Capitella teleta]
MSPEDTAIYVLKQVPLVDGHNDLAGEIRSKFKSQVDKVDLRRDMSKYTQTDIPRLRKGRLGGQFWSAYVPCNMQFTDAVRVSMEQCDIVKRLVLKYPETFEFVTSAAGIQRAFSRGHVASMIGLEGGHSIDSSLATLRQFYDIGVRYMTLTHTCNTPWADASPVDLNSTLVDHNGLTDFGKVVVKEMNRMGMLVDLSHVSKKTMSDALDIAESPVIFSHSSAWSICHHHRNVHDDILRRVRDNNGIVMVNFNPEFVNCFPNKIEKVTATLEQVANHVDHIRNISGVDHVGVGSDFDGIPNTPFGLQSVADFPNLFAELAKRGWSIGDLKKLASGNLIRVFHEVEEVRDSMKNMKVFPHEEIIPEEFVSDIPCRPDL